MKTAEKARELVNKFLNEQIDKEEHERGMPQLITGATSKKQNQDFYKHSLTSQDNNNDNQSTNCNTNVIIKVLTSTIRYDIISTQVKGSRQQVVGTGVACRHRAQDPGVQANYYQLPQSNKERAL